MDLSKYFPEEQFMINNAHKRLITSISVDPSGARFLSSGLDGSVKMWDFSGMRKSIHYFHKIKPEEDIPVNSVQWNSQGKMFLAIVASSAAKIYDREGVEVGQTPKGDMYIKDLNHTKGHTSHINNGQWSPAEPSKFATWSNDGTIRTWDASNLAKNLSVFKLKNRRNLKFNCSSGCFTGQKFGSLAAANSEGAIFLFDLRLSKTRPSKVLRKAHSENFDINCLLSENEIFLYSKSLNGEFKKWDLRKFKENIASTIIPNESPFSPLIFTPDKKYIAAIKTDEKSRYESELLLIEKSNLKTLHSKSLDERCVCLFWSKKIDQILLGSAQRSIRMLYKKESKKGAFFCLNGEKYQISDDEIVPIIDKQILREARKKDREKLFNGGMKIENPKMSQDVLNRRKIIRTSFVGSLLKQHHQKNMRDETPRESLLRYQKKAKENPVYFGKNDKEKNNK